MAIGGSRLEQVVAAVTAQLPSAGAGITIHIGSEFLMQNEAPPRIVWVPTKDRYGPPRGVGGNPRNVRTRHVGYECHVWGVDYEAAELLADQVQAALYFLYWGVFQVTEGQWPQNLGATAGEVTQFGRNYVFFFTIDIPIAEAGQTTGTATSAPLTTVPSS